MKTLSRSLQLFALLTLAQMTAFGQTNFLVTPSLGFQVSFPGLEDYQYQVSSSTDLTNWTPVTDLQTSCGGIETFSFGMTNGSDSFYRVEEFPPDLASRIVGLTNIFFDNAVFQGQGAAMTVSGFRAQSRDYNLNDYLTATFQFDLCKQAFSLTSFQAFTNVGVVCGQSPQFFMKDATDQLTMTNGAAVLSANTAYSLTTTGQVLTVSLEAAQSFAFYAITPPVNTTLILNDPNGKVVDGDTIPSGVNYYAGGSGGLLPGVYSLQLIPQGVASETFTFSFHNDNSHTLRVLTNGMNFSTSIGFYAKDYDKFQIAMNGGQTLTLTLPGTGANLTVFNSLGVSKYNRAGNGALIFTAPTNDTYYVVYWASDLGNTHNYSTTVSITP